jgi:hypothetical protein
VNFAQRGTSTRHSARPAGSGDFLAVEITKKRTQPMTQLIDGLWIVGAALSLGFTAYGAFLCLGLNYRSYQRIQARVIRLALFRA